jgi:integrase
MVFIIPGALVKNGEDRLVVCNVTARSVVEAQRGKHSTHVFNFRGKPLNRMLSNGWINARKRAGLELVRVHDMKHTFGRRLRAVGVSFEDRQDLLGHRSGRITTHYSSAELQNLYEASNKVCDARRGGVTLTLLKNRNQVEYHRVTQNTKSGIL